MNLWIDGKSKWINNSADWWETKLERINEKFYWTPYFTFIITQINGSVLSISMQIGPVQIINETEIDGE